MNLAFDIQFHSPFRVETGNARDGLDNTVDLRDLLPASSLKGTMRASADRLLGSHPLIYEIFGGNGDTGSWDWQRAVFNDYSVLAKNRIQIDSETHTVMKGHLQRSEAVYASDAKFEIFYAGSGPVPDRHLTVIVAAARGVHSLGADRNRGYGWVTIRPTSPDAPSPANLAESLLKLRDEADRLVRSA